MYYNTIAKVISERTGCDISAVKPESTSGVCHFRD